MPNYEPNFDLVGTWVYQSLIANATLVSTHGSRFYDGDTVPGDPKHPYIYWTKTIIGGPQYMGIAGKILREQYRVSIRSRIPNPGASVTAFGISGASSGQYYSLQDLNVWAKHIYDATVGHNGKVITKNAVRLGMVTESVYRQPWEFSLTHNGVKFVERGVILEVMVQYI